ncbi:MAG: SIS domain-containing protein [Methanobrevibacter sp.]|jgi:6-phospho-3-hexuloisomerase|nr:SIS domain-containing protein [Candidatus Methanovirga meridionalis]
MLIENMIKTALEDMKKLIIHINDDNVNELIEIVLTSDNIFTIGSGLSNYVASNFAAKLARRGINSHVVGNVSTPAVKKEDCIVAFSKLGESQFVLNTISKAKELINPKIVLITSNPNSSLGKLTDLNINIKKFELSEEKNLLKNKVPYLFELTSDLLVDVVIANIYRKTEYNQTVSFGYNYYI